MNSQDHKQTGNSMISATEHPKKTISVKGKTMSYVEMGDSDKLGDSGPDRYTLLEHREYFDAALEALGVRDRVTFVDHDQIRKK